MGVYHDHDRLFVRVRTCMTIFAVRVDDEMLDFWVDNKVLAGGYYDHKMLAMGIYDEGQRGCITMFSLFATQCEGARSPNI